MHRSPALRLLFVVLLTLTCTRSPQPDSEWTPDEVGLPGYAIGTGLSSGPDGVVYAAVYREGAVYTLRPGESWQSGSGLDRLAAYGVAAHPVERGVALTATVGGLYRTGDAGKTWQRVEGIEAAYSVAFDRQGQAWVGALAGIWTLTPAGTLRQVAALLPNEAVLTIAPAVNSLYLGTSTGVSWLNDGQLHRIFAGRQVVSSIAVDGTDRVVARIEGRLFRYGGDAIWSPITIPGPVMAITAGPDRFLAATERNGVLESRDGGTTWQPIGSGIEGTVYAVAGERSAISNQRSATAPRQGALTRVPGIGYPLGVVWRLFPAAERELGGDQASSPFAFRLSPWEALTRVPSGCLSPAGEREPSPSQTAFLGDPAVGAMPLPAPSRSGDRSYGGRWSVVGGWPGDRSYDDDQLERGNPFNPLTQSVDGSFWAATSHGVLAFDGSSWRETGPGFGRPMVRALAVNGTIWAATSDGVYRRDGGRWLPAGRDLANVLTLALLPVGDRLLAGTWERGVVEGDGRGWQTITSAEYRRAIIPAITRSGETIVARVEYARTILSRDDGRTWTLVDSGLERRTVFSLASNAGEFWAGTDSGVFRLTGDRWERLAGDPADGTIPALLATASGLLVGTSDGLWKPANDGWVSAGLEGHGIVSLVAGKDDEILAGTSDDGVYLFRQGEWRGIGPAGTRVSAVAFDARDGSVVVATDSSVLRRKAP